MTTHTSMYSALWSPRDCSRCKFSAMCIPQGQEAFKKSFVQCWTCERVSLGFTGYEEQPDGSVDEYWLGFANVGRLPRCVRNVRLEQIVSSYCIYCAKEEKDTMKLIEEEGAEDEKVLGLFLRRNNDGKNE